MSEPTAAAPVCYRHPDRETWIRCQRCERPICPDCMNPASVGFQCPSCVKEGAKSVRTGRLPYGGEHSANPALTTYVLIAINVAVWLLIRSATSDNPAARLSDRLALRPRAVDVGIQGLPGGLHFDGVSGGAYWQLLTSAFAHVSVTHIAFNMIALYFLGPQLEAILGRVRFLALYLLSALTGSVAVMLLSDPVSSTLGASGAIFGLLGALLVVGLKLKADIQQILVWVGINVAFTVFAGSNISWQGHLGGFVGGAATAAIIVYAPRANRTTFQWAGLAGVLVVSLAVIAVRAAALA
ncbi:MAG: Rhomboid family protein [Marmoricola sp.]|nr:Rhomboid family protein [Marmoricola sp.]